MSGTAYAIPIVLTLLAGTLIFMEAGRRLGMRRLARDPESAKAGAGAVEGAVFGLMGLLVAFTFNGAAQRFDTRRTSAVDEADCIGTAWLRLDLLPPAEQPAVRAKLRQYAETRLEAFRKLPDVAAFKGEEQRASALQAEIWRLAVAASSSLPQATMLVLPALNEMFDEATRRGTIVRMHPPLMIYIVLISLVFASALLAGYAMGAGKVRNWFHTLAFVVILTLAIYVILDFEFPRLGLIRIHGIDQVFVDLLQGMKP